jgi:hypothetical protein
MNVGEISIIKLRGTFKGRVAFLGLDMDPATRNRPETDLLIVRKFEIF